MGDYEPVDLSALCNVGVEVLGEGAEDVGGEQSLRGLPFLIGGAGKQFIALSESDAAVTIPIGRSARRVIVAHSLLETEIPAGGPVGIPVADYVFRLADGREVTVPVRERFEIAAVPPPPPTSLPRATRLARSRAAPGEPYQAVTDGKHLVLPRKSGEWDEAGRRQTEVVKAMAGSYYLWAWESPEPSSVVESLTITPRGPRFIVAGVTLGHLDEHPFARQGRRPARIVLTDPAEASEPPDLDVEVDRGDATYVYALPEATPDGFLDDYYKGWGEEQNEKSSPSYVEVSAVPSATVTVKQGDRKLGSVNWGDVEAKGSAEDAGVRLELVDPGKNWVNVTVLDDDTGKPVPCRVHFRSMDGVPYQPHGYHDHVNSNLGTWHNDVGGDLRLGQITYAYIDGPARGGFLAERSSPRWPGVLSTTLSARR